MWLGATQTTLLRSPLNLIHLGLVYIVALNKYYIVKKGCNLETIANFEKSSTFNALF